MTRPPRDRTVTPWNYWRYEGRPCRRCRGRFRMGDRIYAWGYYQSYHAECWEKSQN